VRRGQDVVAAISVSGPVGRLSEQPGDKLGAAVVDAARRVEAALAARQI
jgi:DNA-binding IclR family transcriptional regulator